MVPTGSVHVTSPVLVETKDFLFIHFSSLSSRLATGTTIPYHYDLQLPHSTEMPAFATIATFTSVGTAFRRLETTSVFGQSAFLANQPFAVSDASIDAASTTFEPVLNIPAFGAFFFIAIVFGLLQYRIAAIGEAANRRTQALSTLRELKSLEIDGADIPVENMEKAKENYRVALEEVERLRTVIPGIARIAPPPSESENRERMLENVAAAKQFLDLDISSTLPNDSESISSQSQGLSPVLLGTLAIVGLSQVALLFLFAFGPDPGASF